MMRRRSATIASGESLVSQRQRTGSYDDATQRLDRAVNSLRRLNPKLSAAEPASLWQKLAIGGLAAAMSAAAVFTPAMALPVLLILLAPPFLCVTLLRGAALAHIVSRPPKNRDVSSPCQNDHLPTYSVLVPLFKERAAVPGLLSALRAIDYPPEKLEIFLILEAVDVETQAAIGGLERPDHVHVIVVPDGEPRTKPRALNYALSFATGDNVVVYDAEDWPGPGQLRQAAQALQKDARLGCVQARLNIYNSDETWLTRQFTIEYTALFDCILPTLERLRLPVPLGGTSNHFPRKLLNAVGGWDPFNVTEDADLGIRLARLGWLVGVLRSTTWEEAPTTFRNWLGQRTRWLKGWMQTYLVHTREPLRCLRELGFLRFAGLHVVMGGLILSALVHPWFYVLLALSHTLTIPSALPEFILTPALWWIGIINLVAGYATGVTLGCIAVMKRGQWRLAASAFLMPVYWLLISIAAYRALLELIVAPYRWEKTDHHARAAPPTTPVPSPPGTPPAPA